MHIYLFGDTFTAIDYVMLGGVSLFLAFIFFMWGSWIGMDRTQPMIRGQEKIQNDLERMNSLTPYWAMNLLVQVEQVHRKTFNIGSGPPVPPPAPPVTHYIPKMSDYHNPEYWARVTAEQSKFYSHPVPKSKPTVEGRLNKIERDLYEKPILRQDQV